MRFIKTLLLLLTPVIIFAGINVTNELTHEYYTEAGKVIIGTINVKNGGSDPEKVRAFVNDYLFYADGSNDYADAGSIERSNAKWISISPENATIDPKSTITIDYTITVPRDKRLNGSYWSIIMVEETPDITPDLKERTVGVVVNTRFGIQIITNFGINKEPELKFIDTRVIEEGEERYIRLDLENTGSVTTRSTLKVEVYNMDGKLMGLFEGENKRTYPGTSVNLRCDLSMLKKGKYKALVMAECEDNKIFGANVNLEL